MKRLLLLVLLLSAVMLVAEEFHFNDDTPAELISFDDDYRDDFDWHMTNVNFPKSNEEMSIYFHGDTTAVKTRDNCYAVVGVLYMLELYEEYEQECESVYEQHYVTDPITGERFVYAETCGVNPTFNGYIEFIKNKLGVD